MSFMMKFAVCLLAISTAAYASAQEKAGTTQNQTNSSQVEKARTQSDSPSATENQNRRQENTAKSTDAQNRATDVQNRANENRTGKDQNRNQRDVTTRDTTTQRTDTREQHANAGNSSPIDSQLASCLLLGNQKEVTISQFAAERAKNEKVKEFARQMVKEHTQAISMLQRFAGPDSSKDLSSGDLNRSINRSETTTRSTTTTDSNRASQDGDRNANRDATNNRRANENQNAANRSPDSPAAVSDTPARATSQADRNANDSSERTSAATAHVRSEHDAMPDKMLAIQREVAQKCIAMAKQELEQSNNFDQAYVGMQIAEHMGMIAHLETYKSYASPELGKVISESLDTAQGHLRHAKELVMEIGHDQSGNNRSNATSNSSSSDATKRNATDRDTNPRNSTNRDDATPRREGAFKKDAPKS